MSYPYSQQGFFQSHRLDFSTIKPNSATTYKIFNFRPIGVIANSLESGLPILLVEAEHRLFQGSVFEHEVLIQETSQERVIAYAKQVLLDEYCRYLEERDMEYIADSSCIT